jgi:hypothetical protein
VVPGAKIPWGEYYYVWCPEAFRPSRRYSTEAKARAQAEYLRAKLPDKKFLVFRAVCVDTGEQP